MESKKHVFIDNDEARKDLIIGVLDKYCVPRKIITETESDMFGNHTNWYDIEINVNDKAWELINGKVKEVLALEDSFDLRCKPGIGESKKEIEEPSKPERKSKNTSLGGLVSSLFNSLASGFIDTPEDIDKILERQGESPIAGETYVKYEDLPEGVQNDLKMRMPEEMLKSPNCRIKLHSNEHGYGISVYYVN